jgi:hypothetical protein
MGKQNKKKIAKDVKDKDSNNLKMKKKDRFTSTIEKCSSNK